MVRPSLIRMHLASLLALVLLLLGMADPVLSLAETLEDRAPTLCVSVMTDQDRAPSWGLTAQDVGDELPDLEQLLRPRETTAPPAPAGSAAFPPPPALGPPLLSPPRLRPPIFRA